MPFISLLHYVACDGCGETWSWSTHERATATFNEWYQFLDQLLLEHLADRTDCWDLLTRWDREANPGDRHHDGFWPALPTQDQPHHDGG